MMLRFRRSFIYCVLLVGLLFSCSSNDIREQTTSENIGVHPEIDWIIGNWVGGVEEEGLFGGEIWTKVSDDRYAGDAELRNEGQLIPTEHMEISTQDGHHCLIVEHGEAEPVIFDFISADSNGFICRNDENDFPKQIEYRREGEELIAIISDGAPTVEFRFVKQ